MVLDSTLDGWPILPKGCRLGGFVQRFLNGKMANKNKSEVTSLIKDKEGIEAAFAVHAGLQQKKADLLLALKSSLEEQGLEIWKWTISNNGFDRHMYFDVPLGKIGEELVYFAVYFHGPGLTGLSWGISTYTKHVERTEALDELCNKLNRNYGTGKIAPYWPWWTWGNDEPSGKFFRDWNNRPEPWIAIQNGDMASKIIETVEEIKNFLHS